MDYFGEKEWNNQARLEQMDDEDWNDQNQDTFLNNLYYFFSEFTRKLSIEIGEEAHLTLSFSLLSSIKWRA